MKSARLLGCAGLAQQDVWAVDVAQKWVADYLNIDLQLVDADDAEIVIVDPETEEGLMILAKVMLGVKVIGIFNNTSYYKTTTMLQVFRPLRPSNLANALRTLLESNQNDDKANKKQATLNKPITTALRDAMLASCDLEVCVLEGIEDSPLVIDPNRGRIRGPLTQLTHCLPDTKHNYTTYWVNIAKGQHISPGAAEAPLYQLLWKMAFQISPDTALFEDIESAPLRLSRWPNVAAASVSRTNLRALTLLRYRQQTMQELCDITGRQRHELLPLLNATWLTGELEVVTEKNRAKAKRNNRDTNHSKISLIARIRRKFSTA